MSRAPRILLAGIFAETHCFRPGLDGAEVFDIARGQGLLAKAGDGSTIDGFLEVAAVEGWQVVPAVNYGGLATATIAHGVFEAFWAELEPVLRDALAEGLDGIWLNLHGAMMTDACADPEGELLGRIRALPGAGALPLFGVVDLHASFTEAMARLSDGLVVYRENPHTDARAAAVLSARLLARALAEGRRPVTQSACAPLVWPPSGTGTADSPMRDLQALARRIEAEDPGIWAVNVVGGYAYNDVAETGVAFSVVSDGGRASAALDRLVALAVELHAQGLPEEWDLEAALADIAPRPGGPYLLVEPAENIGGGATGDGTTLLHAFLRHRIAGACVVIADPVAVAALADATPGEVRRMALGAGLGGGIGDLPVEAEVRFLRRSDGRFAFEDRQNHLAASQGAGYDMGPCAVVGIDPGITVLLTSRATPPFDLGQLRSQGIVPEAQRVIAVKAAVGHRRAYDPIAAGSYTVTTPGHCTSNPALLPYRRLRRPVWPVTPGFVPLAVPA